MTHVLPLTAIERLRLLPVAGTVLVRAGQDVAATDVIATAEVYAEHISLDLARSLGVSKSRVASLLQREIGEQIPEGAVIASRPGFVARTVRAPKAGKLVAVGGGQALLQVNRKPFELRAGLPGRVLRIEADFGAVIRTTGSWIQGVWGNGRIAAGELYVAASEPDHVIEAKDLDPSKRGQIMFAGYCSKPETLQTLQQIKMSGLILGSMATTLRPVAAQMPYPIMLLEGFGKIPINDVAFRLLSTSRDREAALNAEPFNRVTGERPEVILPIKGQGETGLPMQLAQLAVGSQVRVLKDPYQSQTGTVTRMLGVRRLPNGLHADAVEISLPETDKAIVPLANLEVIG
jgi:hypothetical protein